MKNWPNKAPEPTPLLSRIVLAHAPRQAAWRLIFDVRPLLNLSTYGVTGESRLKLEHFIFKDTKEKAAGLAQRLAEKGYTGSHDHSASDKKQFLVTGWTPPMRMDEETIADWPGRRCDVGRGRDCEFDGWGTNPRQ